MDQPVPLVTHSTSTSEAEKELLEGNGLAHKWTKKLKSEKKSRNDWKLWKACHQSSVAGPLRLCCRPGAVLPPPWESGSLTRLLPCPASRHPDSNGNTHLAGLGHLLLCCGHRME